MKEKIIELLVKFKPVFGVVCILFGFFVAIWIFSTSHQLIFNQEAIQLTQNGEPVKTTLSLSGEDISIALPPEIFSYLVPIILLFIMAKVATALISNGVKLYGSEYKTLMKQMETMQEELEDNLECIKKSIIVNSR